MKIVKFELPMLYLSPRKQPKGVREGPKVFFANFHGYKDCILHPLLSSNINKYPSSNPHLSYIQQIEDRFSIRIIIEKRREVMKIQTQNLKKLPQIRHLTTTMSMEPQSLEESLQLITYWLTKLSVLIQKLEEKMWYHPNFI